MGDLPSLGEARRTTKTGYKYRRVAFFKSSQRNRRTYYTLDNLGGDGAVARCPREKHPEERGVARGGVKR